MSVVALGSRWKGRSRSSVAVVALFSFAAFVGVCSSASAFGQSSYSGAGTSAAPLPPTGAAPAAEAQPTGAGTPTFAAPSQQPSGTTPTGAQPASRSTGAAPAAGTRSTGAGTENPTFSPAPATTNLAANEIAPFFQAPTFPEGATPEISGDPLTLEKVLYGVASPSERRRRLLAYWDLAGKLAVYNLSVQRSSFVAQCVAKAIQQYGGEANLSADVRALALAAQTNATAEREIARLDFLRAQYEFDAAFTTRAARRAAFATLTAKAFESAPAGTNPAAGLKPPTALLYVPTSVPTTLEYQTRAEEAARDRRLSPEAARLSVSIPILFEALSRRAESSKQEFAALDAAFGGTPSGGELFAALDRTIETRRELIDAAVEYNRAIGAYSSEVVPGFVRGADLLATLNQPPSGKSLLERPSAVASVPAKTFADDAPKTDASSTAASPNPATAQASASDLAPTPGANFEPVSATVETSANETNAESASTSASTSEPPKPEAAPTDAPKPADAAPASEPPKPENAPGDAPKPADDAPASEPSEPETPPTDTRVSQIVPTTVDGWIVRAQAPDEPNAAPTTAGAAPSAPNPGQTPSQPAPQASAQPSAADVAASVLAIGSAIFATPAPETSENAVASETPFSLRDALNAVSPNPSKRFAVVRTYWELKGFVARVEIEKATFASYAKAVDDFKAKLASGAQPDAAFVANSGSFLAGARRAQARIAEATLQKREAQLELAQATSRAPEAGRPLPSTRPFFGPSYRLSTPPRFDAVATVEAATIPEKLAAIQKIGALLGPAATLVSPDVSPVTDADPLAALETIETKRQTALLFVELVVSANVSIADYVARFPAGYVSADRFAEALVGPEK